MSWDAYSLIERTRRWRTFVVVAGGVGVVLISVPRPQADVAVALNVLLSACVAYFALELFLKIRVAVMSGRTFDKLTSLDFAVDIVAVAPIAFVFVAGVTPPTIWLLGALWLLKLEPAMASLCLLARVVRSEARSLVSVGILFFIVLFIAAAVIHLVERDAQPDKYGSLVGAFYWAIATLTSTGYGDLVPVTELGRLVAGLTMVSGIAVFGLWIGILATGFAHESRRVDFMQSWEVVARSSLFAGLSPSEVIEVASMLKRWDVPARTIVVQDGRAGDCMYFIASGQAEVRVKGRLHELRPPAFFGELALLENGMRTATVVTTAPTTLLVLNRADFHIFLARHPQLARTIESVAMERARKNRIASPVGGEKASDL